MKMKYENVRNYVECVFAYVFTWCSGCSRCFWCSWYFDIVISVLWPTNRARRQRRQFRPRTVHELLTLFTVRRFHSTLFFRYNKTTINQLISIMQMNHAGVFENRLWSDWLLVYWRNSTVATVSFHSDNKMTKCLWIGL